MLNEHIELALRDADFHLFEIPFNHDGNPRRLERLDGLDVAPEDHERVTREIEALAAEAVPRLVVEYRAPESGIGPVRWHRARGSLVRDEHGIATHLVGSTQDITELKESQQETRRLQERIERAELEQADQAARRAEEARRALEQQQLVKAAEEEARRAVELLQLATRLSDVTVWSVDLTLGDLARADAVSINLGESLGYGPDEIPADLAASLELVVLPEDRPGLVGEVQAYLDRRSEKLEAEYRVRRKDGSVEWQLCRGVAIRDTDGRPTRLTGTSVFVTRIKHAEAELRAINEKFDLAMEQFDFRLTELDLRRAASPASVVSNGSENWNGRGLRSMPLASYLEYFRRAVMPEDLPRALELLESAIRGDVSEVVMECRVRNPIGDGFRWRLGRVKVYYDESGAPERCLSFSYDIQQLKLAEEGAQRVLERVTLAEEEARRAVELLKLATSLSEVTVWSIDLTEGDLASAKVTFINMAESLGYEPDETPVELSSTLELNVLAEDRPGLVTAVQAYLDGRTERFEHEARVRRKNGTVEWQLARGVAIRDADGRPKRFTGTSVFVTRIKHAEAELRAINEKFALVVRLFDFRITEIDLRAVASPANAISDDSGNRDGSGLRSMPLASYFDYLKQVVMPEDLPRALELLEGAIRGDIPDVAMECRVRTPPGDGFRWRLGRIKVYCDESGVPERCISFSHDIQPIKTAEEAARRAAQQLRLATDLTGVSIWSYEFEGGDLASAKSPLIVDSTIEELGYDNGDVPRELLGRMATILRPEDRPRAYQAVQDYLTGKSPAYELSYGLVQKDGETRWKLSRGIVTRDGTGRPLTFVGTAVDITQLKQTQEELQRVKDRLEFALRASNTATWDLETPDGLITSGFPVFDNAWEQCGYDAPSDPQLAAQVLTVLLPPGEAQRFMANVQAFFDGTGHEFEIEQRVLHKDGTERWHLKRGTVERNAEGRVTRFSGTSIDITDRKQMERELERVKERLELALLGSKAYTWDVDVPDGQAANGVPIVNNSWEHLGYDSPSRAFVASEALSVVLPPGEGQRYLAKVQAFFDGTGREFEAEQRMLRKDGTERWHLKRGVAKRNADGGVTRFTGTSIDITDRKQMERALLESEQRFRGTFENAAVGMILTDMDGKFLEYNRRFCEFLGYSPEELADRCLFELMDPDEAVLHLENQQSVVRGEAPAFTRDTRYFRKDGAVVWGNVTVSVIQRHADGTPAHVMGILQDITERKALEAEIRHGRETLELAMRGSDISVVVVDVTEADRNESRQTFFNFWEPMGIDPAEVPDDFEGWSRLSIHPDDYDAVLADFRAVAEPRRPHWYIEHRFFHADGSVRWRLSRGTILYDDAGKVSRFLATAIDITRLKQIESELSRAREAAEAANRAKDEFLANVSHEIRTPMNAILGMTELALDSAPSDHQRQLLSTVRSAAKNLLGIINDLLDFSKIAAGKLTLDRTPFSLRAAVGDTLRALSVRAHRKGLELLCHVQPEVPDALDGDAGRLRQVLMNLVGNAIKFTQKGEIEVDVALSSGPSLGAEDVQLVFTVRDTGIGIAPEKQATIFRAFEQGDSTTTRDYGGTGLGLTISAQLAALMSGDITVDSAPGQGSKFRFTARFAPSMRPGGGTTSPERLSGLRVLIVDDNETNRRILEDWLKGWRMQPTAVSDAVAVMDALTRAHETSNPFSLVLLDGRMPDVDGVTLAGQIRHHWGPRAPRLILLSSGDDSDIVAKSRANGVLAFLLKPVQQSELLEAIWAVMNLDLAPPSEAAKSGEKSVQLSALNILVAEDNEFNVALLEELLRRRGHHARFARDGRAALELALAPEAACDLMLLDLHMPGLDGFQVARAIREDEQGSSRHLPIIALTARSSARDRERCIAAGMDEFLSKPIEAAALWAVMERLVRRWSLVGGVAPRVESHLLDPRAILRACDGEASLLERIVVVFCRSLPNHVSRVRTALGARDFASLREAGHSLAGTVGTFSTVTADIALTLEDEALRQDLESCTALVERLASMCDALLEETTTLSFDSLKL